MTAISAYVLHELGKAERVELTDADLPEGEVTVDVSASSLNYKDALAITGRAPIARRFPMVCGIDLAGTVSASTDPSWRPGDEVLVTGWGLSETHPGGYTTRQRVPAHMLTRRPDGFTLHETMAIGTAGLTAMLAVLRLEEVGLTLGRGPVLVTGAAGGVGSVAVALLSAMGHEVVASTGRPALHDWLRALGASSVIDRGELSAEPTRPLDATRWAAAVDSVGGATLGSVLRGLSYGGAVAACGLAGGDDLPTTVLPFILRGVSLLGVESVRCPAPVREVAWARLAQLLPAGALADITTTAGFDDLPALAERILAGAVRGRVVVDVHR